jgi:pentatricopeptide repeat protein
MHRSRAGFPQGASEIFSLMEHMGCEPDRASYNILVDAYGRAGLHQGTHTCYQFAIAQQASSVHFHGQFLSLLDTEFSGVFVIIQRQKLRSKN